MYTSFISLGMVCFILIQIFVYIIFCLTNQVEIQIPFCDIASTFLFHCIWKLCISYGHVLLELKHLLGAMLACFYLLAQVRVKWRKVPGVFTDFCWKQQVGNPIPGILSSDMGLSGEYVLLVCTLLYFTLSFNTRSSHTLCSVPAPCLRALSLSLVVLWLLFLFMLPS